MTEQLKPCPFCGTNPNFTSVTDLTDNFDHGFSIWCSECGIEMADEYKDEVAKRWNNRSARQSELLEEARYILRHHLGPFHPRAQSLLTKLEAQP